MKQSTITLLLALAIFCAFPYLGNYSVLSQDLQKPTAHLNNREAWDSKEGGETIETAIEIELPFYDTGATCDNLNDYDEECPYSGSTSPDVVYTFLATDDTDVKVDLCGSLYDTKVYMYDENLNIIDCNDDFYTGPPWLAAIRMFSTAVATTRCPSSRNCSCLLANRN